MVDSQPVEEEVRRTETGGIGMEPQKGPTEPAPQTQTTPSPAFVMENIDMLRIMIKEHDQQVKVKTILKMVDEIFERVRAFIRGEVATESAEMVRSPQWDKRNARLVWSGGQEKARNRNESISFPPPRPLIGTPEKQNLNKFCDYHGDRGHNTDDCYQLKKQIEEAVASGKLSHLVKDIRRNNEKNGSQVKGGVKIINMVNAGANRKRPYERERSGLTEELTYATVPQNNLTDKLIVLEVMIEVHQVRRIHIDGGSSSEIMYEHCFKNFSANVRSRLRKCKISVGRILRRSISPSRLDLPPSNHGRTRKKQDGTNGICDSKVSLTLQCHNGKNLNEKSRSRGINHSFYDQVPDEPGGCHDGDKQGDPIGMIREQAILQTRRNLGQRSGKEPMFPKEGEGEDSTRKKITICSKRPGHCVTIGSTLSIGCKQQLVNVLRKSTNIFAWAGSEGTAVPRFVMEHQLKAYPLAEPVIHKKRPLTPNRRHALKEKVFKWLKEGIIRRVQHPEWITNAILVKMENGVWQMQMDYSSLNRICAKDMYPFLEVEEKLASLMGYPYKCFLRLPTENSQIRMVEEGGVQLPVFYVSRPLQGPKTYYTITEKAILTQIHIARSLRTIFQKHKVKVVTDGPMPEMLKISDINGRLAKWAAELRMYDVSYIQSKEANGQVVSKFCRQKEPMPRTASKKDEGTSWLNNRLQEEPTSTPKALRFYLSREANKEGSGVGMILVNPEEKTYSYAIRLNFSASDDSMNYKAQLAGLFASASKGMKDLHVSINSQMLVDQVEGNKVPRTKETKKYREAVMDATTSFHRFQIMYLPKALIPKAEVLTGLATIKLEFLNQEVSVGVKTRSSVEVEAK
ncbi:reverse transcriptase domain-containing protein [Tanacetum coccineum]